MQTNLLYYPDSKPGLTRRRRGRGYSYYGDDGSLIGDTGIRQRLSSLAVPPAYENVWYSPHIVGHLQATGRDVKGRKQYIYHPDWTRAQAAAKYDGLAEFGAALPKIRRRVARDLKADVGEQSFALAAAVTLVDRGALRIGNPQYRDSNGSYGALTLRNRHLSLSGNKIDLRYKAKGGKTVRRRMNDRTLARTLHKISDLPGGTLLSWVDDDGTPRDLRSEMFNTYIAEASGVEGATAKTFRTWAGTRAAFEAAEAGTTSIKEMAEAASAVLYNTASIARNSYIHPDVIDLADQDPPVIKTKAVDGLRASETRLLAFLTNS